MQEGRGWEVKSTHFSAQSSLRTAQANAASERLQETQTVLQHSNGRMGEGIGAAGSGSAAGKATGLVMRDQHCK